MIYFIKHLYNLCHNSKNPCWDEVRNYLICSNESKKEKKEQVCYQPASRTYRWTCLYEACIKGAPDDILISMIDIGGRELVMAAIGLQRRTALHAACHNRRSTKSGASYNVIKKLIEVGGKDLVMAKSSNGDTALHSLCYCTNKHFSSDKIKLILEAANIEEILQARNNLSKTPLELATKNKCKASAEIKDLLRPRQPSSTVLNNGKATTESNKRRKRQVTPSKQCTASSTTPPEDTHISFYTIRQLQEQLKEANNRARKILHDFDEKCADNINLQNTLQVECAKKFQFEGALLQKGEQVENLQSEITALKQQAISSDQENTRHEMEDAANAIEPAGVKRKRGNEEYTFTSDEIEVSAGDINAEEMVMEQYLLERKWHSMEREHHSKILTQLVETRRELRIVRSELKNNASTDTTLQHQGDQSSYM